MGGRKYSEELVRDLFFFYTLGEKKGCRLLKEALKADYSPLQRLLNREIADMIILLNNDNNDPKYAAAFKIYDRAKKVFAGERMAAFVSDEGIEKYLNYLMSTTNVTVKSLRDSLR